MFFEKSFNLLSALEMQKALFEKSWRITECTIIWNSVQTMSQVIDSNLIFFIVKAPFLENFKDICLQQVFQNNELSNLFVIKKI